MQDNRMHIATSVNNAFVMPLKVMLYSLAENTAKDLHIYLLYNDLNDRNRESIRKFVSKYCHAVLHEVLIDGSLFRNCIDPKSRFPVETCYRLLLPYIPELSVEKVLWLDADVVVCKNIDDFYDADTNGDYLTATCLFGKGDSERRILHKQRLNIPQEQKYFNPGVLVFHLPEIRGDFSLQQILDFCHQNKEKLTFLDQDVLNFLMGHKTLFFDEYIYQNLEHLTGERIKDARLIHYITFMKPWELYYQGDRFALSCFWNYARKCGFKLNYAVFLIGYNICKVVYPLYLKIRYNK